MGGFGSMGEGVTVDAEGNVYAGEVGPIQGMTKFVPSIDVLSRAGGQSLFTWRNVLAAGVLAFAALGLLTAVKMVKPTGPQSI